MDLHRAAVTELADRLDQRLVHLHGLHLVGLADADVQAPGSDGTARCGESASAVAQNDGCRPTPAMNTVGMVGHRPQHGSGADAVTRCSPSARRRRPAPSEVDEQCRDVLLDQVVGRAEEHLHHPRSFGVVGVRVAGLHQVEVTHGSKRW